MFTRTYYLYRVMIIIVTTQIPYVDILAPEVFWIFINLITKCFFWQFPINYSFIEASVIIRETITLNGTVNKKR